MDENLNPEDQDVVTITIPEDNVITGLPDVDEKYLDENNKEQSAEIMINGQKTEVSTNSPQDIHIDDLEEPKNKGGRPCEYCKDADNIQKITDGYYKECITAKPVIIPYIEELAMRLERDTDVLNEWNKKTIGETDELEHPMFHAAIKKIKDFQRLCLLRRTIGRYNPSGAIFQLKANHGLIETEKKVVAGDKTEPLLIEVIEEKQHYE